MSTKRALIHVLLCSEQSAGVVSMIESCREHPPTPDYEVRATAPGVEGT
jgi:hypothetical protein